MGKLEKVSLVLVLVMGLATFVLVSRALAATGTPPPCPPNPPGKDGCKCDTAACQQPSADQCNTSFNSCTQDSDCWGRTLNGYYIGMVVTTPQTCVTSGPLQGNGCTNPTTATPCTKRYYCYCFSTVFGSKWCSTNDMGTTSSYLPCQQ
jgi:hypothetical protein